MAKYFDEKKWLEAIKKEDWYLVLLDDYLALTEKIEHGDPEIALEIKEETRQFFENHLAKGDVALAKSGPNLDIERKAIDTIIIHHTHNPSGISWQRLNAIQLSTLYVPYYIKPTDPQEKDFQGRPIWSNHFREGQQVFYAYHWLVRMDGRVERLLADNEIGWQAGNWDVNCRSVAICFDGNLEESAPTEKALEAATCLIKGNYPQIKVENIFGHREINSKTTCPGNKFLNNWKLDLINKIRNV